MTNALAIDGGGIRGFIPALVLAEMERRTGRPIASMFDLIAGTSTGGILACALTMPDPLSAEEAAGFYEQDGPKIFNKRTLKAITSAGGLIDERYDTAGIAGVLRRRFGDTRLGAATTRVLVTVYDIEAREPLVLHSDTDPDVTMADAAQASSAAPTYFEPVQVGNRTLIDGGMFATNPAVYAGWTPTSRPTCCSRSAPAARPARCRSRTSRAGARSNGASRWSTSSSTARPAPPTPSSASSPATATCACRRSCATRATTSTTRAPRTSRRCAARPRS